MKKADKQDGAPHTISVVVRDLLESSSFPIPSNATSEGSTNSGDPAKSLGFTSANRYVQVTFVADDSVKDFIEKYKREVISKILPGLQVPGYTES
jgi:proteasome inhibitor subunit 1 (PI31)